MCGAMLLRLRHFARKVSASYKLTLLLLLLSFRRVLKSIMVSLPPPAEQLLLQDPPVLRFCLFPCV